MTRTTSLRKTGIARIDVRSASAVMAALSLVMLFAGFAASTQVHAAPVIAKPVQFLSDETGHGVASGGRAAHRLCRSPIRFLGTAEGRQSPDCKRIQA
ncbi:MAG: hypothetical protein JNK84_13765 [Phreatobacter sp.]|uniref:hypothetical protein n=1 Tax=Phreatobacter sp. TaxID=1966341 RepID=UPI001A48484A|nr:hypothetical protein [Phreatobacter sp.]MBL8570132.1 hypothetical protein [Phreatobacter sp.]